MKIGDDGYLHAINPEADFLAWPRTGMKTIKRDGALRKEHAVHKRRDECGSRTVVGRHWQ